MSSRVSNNTARVTPPANNVTITTTAANTPAANNAAANAPASNAAVNTADAAKFSGPEGFTLADLGRMVNDLEKAIGALEARVSALTGSSKETKPAKPADPKANGPVLPPGIKLPPLPTAAANETPAANAPAANAPANNAPAANAPANNAPATNAPTLNAAVNNAPAANTPVAATGSADQIDQALGQLKELQAYVGKRISDIEALLRASQTDGKGAATDKTDLDRQQAGLQAVAHVLRDAKLKNLTPAEEAVVNPAVKRVHEIAKAIADGDDYNQHAAELFALRHTLIDPAGAGNNKAVTLGAQLVGQLNGDKTTLAAKLKATPNDADKALYKSLIDIEKGLESAKLTRLSPDAEKAALANINRLGEIRDGLVGGTLKPSDAEAEILKLSNALRAPGVASDGKQVKAGAEVLKQIGEAKAKLQDQLRAIDAKVLGGAAPEQFAGDRARLLEAGESLEELATVVKDAKLEQANPAARREVESGLQRASEMAKALGGGQEPTKFRAETFALKQTFQEPLESKNNPAVQSGAGALALLGRAEAANLKKQEELAAKIAKGADPRESDKERAALHRQNEDLETIRHAIEKANLGGLNDKQEAQGAKLIDEVRDIGMKVANGEDFAKHKARFDQLAKELGDLKSFGVEATPPKRAAEPEKPKLEPGGVYQVKNGDFLTKIARERLGDPNRFKDIIELNKDKYPSLVKNPDLIYPGWNLVLPKQ